MKVIEMDYQKYVDDWLSKQEGPESDTRKILQGYYKGDLPLKGRNNKTGLEEFYYLDEAGNEVPGSRSTYFQPPKTFLGQTGSGGFGTNPMSGQTGSGGFGTNPMSGQISSGSFGTNPVNGQIGSGSFGTNPVSGQIGLGSFGTNPMSGQIGSGSFGTNPMNMTPMERTGRNSFFPSQQMVEEQRKIAAAAYSMKPQNLDKDATLYQESLSSNAFAPQRYFVDRYGEMQGPNQSHVFQPEWRYKEEIDNNKMVSMAQNENMTGLAKWAKQYEAEKEEQKRLMEYREKMKKANIAKLLERNYERIGEEEDFIPHAYLDTKGYITMGPGILANNEKEYIKYSFGGEDDAKKREEFKKMAKKRNEIWAECLEKGKTEKKCYNVDAGDYKSATDIRLTDDEMKQMYFKKGAEIVNAYLGRAKKFVNDGKIRPDFYLFDESELAQDGLFDIMYNVGPAAIMPEYYTRKNSKNSGFPKFYNGLNAYDYKKMGEQSHRGDVGNKRNATVKKLFDDAEAEKKEQLTNTKKQILYQGSW